jgi:hypothetical protein
MQIKPTSFFFRICGIAPTRDYSRFLYCIAPQLLIYSALTYISLTSLPIPLFIRVSWFPICVGSLQLLLMCNLLPDGFLSILDEVKAVDEQLEHMGVNIEPQRLSKTIATAFVLLIFRMIHYFLDSRKIQTYLNLIVVNAAWIQHLVFAQMIHKRYSALNAHLARIAATADKTLVKIVETRLDSVFRVHSHLHVIISDISSHYCIYNLAAMVTRFFLTTHFTYCCLQVLTGGEVFDILNNSGSVVFHLLMIICQAVECDLCSKEANRTPLIAHRMLTEHSSLSLWKMVSRFSRLNLDNKVEFSVGGVFSFNMKLLTKMSVMVFSYLAIALQLKDVKLFEPLPSNATTSVNSTVY